MVPQPGKLPARTASPPGKVVKLKITDDFRVTLPLGNADS